MHHIDEHTIELYTLGYDLVKERIAEIEAHLKECHGCRTLAEQMESFYQNAEKGLEKLSILKEQATKALMRLPKDIMPYDVPLGAPVPYRPTTFVGKLAYFTRLHPVVTGVGSFTTLAAMVGALFIGTSDLFKDKNPSYSHINPSSAIVEIYNKENQLLWGFPTQSFYQLSQYDFELLEKKIIISDLDGDKKNEVVTTLQVGKPSMVKQSVTIFSYLGKTIREVEFSEQVQFRGAKYLDNFGATDILCEDYEGNEKKEIITLTNCGRSPVILNRLSNDGSSLGQYFHFGVVKIATINIQGKRRIVLFGQNDVGEPDSLSYAVMSVLDPLKIVGKTEASDSRGFGLPVSGAELFVIKFPLTDMNYLWNTHNRVNVVNEVTAKDTKTISAWLEGTYGGNGLGSGSHPMFEYIFNENVEIIEVKYNSQTLRLRMESVAKGKISGTIDKL